jgi:hypothetical protein
MTKFKSIDIINTLSRVLGTQGDRQTEHSPLSD